MNGEAPGAARRIDAHTHYLAGGLATALESRGELPRISRHDGARVIEYGEGNGHPLLPSMVDLETQLGEMAAEGIDFAVLSVNVPGVDWFAAGDGVAVAREVNDELADLSRQRPDRLAALALLPMQAPERAAEELERAVGLGLRGGVVFSNVAGLDLEAAGCEPVFESAAALEVPIMIHPTYPLSAAATDAYALIPTIGFLVDTSVAALRLILGGIYERHPGFKLYLPHAGSLLPQLAGRIDCEGARFPGGFGRLEVAPSERLRELYTDTVCGWPPALRSTLELVGPTRLMFGSDYPFWQAGVTVETLAAAGFDDETRAAIESANAARLFGLG